MTTWLRALVEKRARRTNPSLSHSLSPTVFYLKHFYSFSNQQKTQHWYFGNWLQINNQQQYTWYVITTNDSQLSCGYTSCLVHQDKCCLPPSLYVFLQVYIIVILLQYHMVSYSILLIVQCILLFVVNNHLFIFLSIDNRASSTWTLLLSFVGQLVQHNIVP